MQGWKSGSGPLSTKLVGLNLGSTWLDGQTGLGEFTSGKKAAVIGRDIAGAFGRALSNCAVIKDFGKASGAAGEN